MSKDVFIGMIKIKIFGGGFVGLLSEFVFVNWKYVKGCFIKKVMLMIFGWDVLIFSCGFIGM